MNFYEDVKKLRRSAIVYIVFGLLGLGCSVMLIALIVTGNADERIGPREVILILLMLTIGIECSRNAIINLTRAPRQLISAQQNGMTMYINGEQTPLIPWTEVREIRTSANGVSKMIVLELVHSNEFIAALTPKQQKALKQLQQSTQAKISMATTACDISNEEIAYHLNEYRLNAISPTPYMQNPQYM